MLNSNSIGSKIADARKKMNLSQAELAQQVSISAQAVGKWERGESMPDILMLNRLAEILGVDLNYFSDRLHSDYKDPATFQTHEKETEELSLHKPKKKFSWNWNMSSGNWVDADFSGLKNLQERFSSSNMKNCKFMNSDLSGLILGNNNIEKCDFSNSDLRNSKIKASNLLNNQFNHSSFIDAQFLNNNIGKCNFSQVDFSGAEFSGGHFDKNNLENALWKFTSFKNLGIADVVFEGTLEDCHFENCAFYGVKFQNANIVNTFFKYNRRFKRVQFENCTVDKLTYAFLKNNHANLDGLSIIEQ